MVNSSRSSSTSTSISTAGIPDIIIQLCNNKHRSSTQKNYYCVWKIFNEFFVKLDRKPSGWEDRITLFVAYLINRGKKSTTVRSYVSAIKAVLNG